MAQLVCEELTLGYDRPILTGLSFEVNAGDYLFILCLLYTSRCV